MRQFAARLTLLAVLSPALLASRDAAACAVCAAGDPTLSQMGSEKTFAGRLRLSGELRVGQARVGDVGLAEQRADFAVAYAPTESLFLSVSLPFLHREIMPHREPSSTVTGIGDVEIRGRGTIWTSNRGHFHHQLAGVVGLKLPTAPFQRDDAGQPLPADLQPGAGAFSPLAGAFYGVTSHPWSFAASATLYLPFAIRDGPHTSDSFRTTAALQYQPSWRFASRVSFNARVDSTGEGYDVLDKNSGGFVGYISPEIVISPIEDFLVTVGAHFPVLQVLHGDHREKAIGALGIIVDI